MPQRINPANSEHAHRRQALVRRRDPVACLDGGVAFRTDVDFIGRQDADLVRLSLNSYGGLGMAEDRDGDYILDEIEQRVEAAVVDYVAANSEPEAAPPTPRRSSRNR